MTPKREWLDTDYYAVLGVSEDADQDTIKKAYRKLARAHHPDSNPDDPNAEQKFKEVGEAYAVVGDADTRKEYDELRRLGAAGLGGFGGAGRPGSGGFGAGAGAGDLNDLLQGLFQQGRAEGGFPSGMGGFGGAPRRQRRQKGRDFEATVQVSFGDALAGARTRLRINGDGPCDTCHGSGAAPGTSPTTCPTCHGSGQVTVDQGPFSFAQPCGTCGGNGQVIADPCATCNGSGRVVKPRELTVRIPAGVRDGAVIRVAGRGGPGSNGGPAGDVLVTVEVEPDELFGRRGDDVTLRVPLTFAEAALGTRLTVPTPHDEQRTIRIPAGTASGRTFRIRGQGAPRGGRKSGTGDLLVTVDVEVPEELTREQTDLLEQLHQLDDTSTRDARLGRGART